MRAGTILLTLAAALLAACQLGAPGGLAQPGKVLPADDIAVTTLDALPPAAAEPEAAVPTATLSAEPQAEPAASPAIETAAEPADTADPATGAQSGPAVEKSPEQLLCEAGKGLWTAAGETGAFFCSWPTRDAGKSCHKAGDCEGQCLARSQTCAPYRPLFGCNEVLDKDGRRMMLCID